MVLDGVVVILLSRVERGRSGRDGWSFIGKIGGAEQLNS
jgi:hypothetical protein